MIRGVVHKKSKSKIVLVSGGFDPVHIGHVQLLEEARELGRLWVIINNDNWLKLKKGFIFMNEAERMYIVKSLKPVDASFLSFHHATSKDMTVCTEIETVVSINPDQQFIFANGGDRKQGNVPEYEVCDRLGVEMVFGIGGEKVQSSSWLVEKANVRTTLESK